MQEGEHTINAEKYPNLENIDQEFLLLPQNLSDKDFYNVFDAENNNFIHPTAIVSSGVKMGKDNFVGAYCIIRGNTKIGNGNKFYSHCSIGSAPEHRSFWDDENNKGTIIGDNCTFREFTTVNAGTENPTIIEDDVVMLRGSHVGHDSKIMRNATLSCNVLIGGHSLIGIFANMGLGSACHQYSRIGHYCMIGMNSTITKKFNDLTSTFQKFAGSPVKHLGRNSYWADNFESHDYLRIIEEFKNETI